MLLFLLAARAARLESFPAPPEVGSPDDSNGADLRRRDGPDVGSARPELVSMREIH
jgi:hypothetical protein